MTEDHGRGLQCALYVRDALGLVDESPNAVPRLVPAVPALPGTDTAEPTEDDVRAWRDWFALLVAEEATGVPGDPLGRLLAAGPTPALGAAAAALVDDADAWHAERKVAHIANFRRQTQEQRLAINRLVVDVERDLGRRAAPFTLHIVTLPVAGLWEHRARRDLVLFSDGSRHDPSRLRDVLTPVVRELA